MQRLTRMSSWTASVAVAVSASMGTSRKAFLGSMQGDVHTYKIEENEVGPGTSNLIAKGFPLSKLQNQYYDSAASVRFAFAVSLTLACLQVQGPLRLCHIQAFHVLDASMSRKSTVPCCAWLLLAIRMCKLQLRCAISRLMTTSP